MFYLPWNHTVYLYYILLI